MRGGGGGGGGSFFIQLKAKLLTIKTAVLTTIQMRRTARELNRQPLVMCVQVVVLYCGINIIEAHTTGMPGLSADRTNIATVLGAPEAVQPEQPAGLWSRQQHLTRESTNR